MLHIIKVFNVAQLTLRRRRRRTGEPKKNEETADQCEGVNKQEAIDFLKSLS